MLELKDAYEILGLDEDASKVDIEKRYGKLVRKYRSGGIEEEDAAGRQVEMDRINEAYNRIISHEDELLEAALPKKKPNPVFKLMGVDEKKARNFLHYHKYHIIFTIIFALIGVYVAVTIFGGPRYDMVVTFIGEYYSDPNSAETGESIEKEVNKRFPEIKGTNIELISVPVELKSQQDSVFNTKALLEIKMGKQDVFILDKRFFQSTVEGGSFANLDTFAGKMGIDIKANSDYVSLIEGKKKPHLYGIDVTSSKVIKKSDISGASYVAVISSRIENRDNAEKFLRLLLSK